MKSQVVIVEKDIDKDRIISIDQFVQFIEWLPYASKWYIYYSLLGATGCRPIECCRLNLRDFDFSDPERPRVKLRLAKARRVETKGVTRITQKIKWRELPVWVAKALAVYVSNNYLTLKGQYLFPSHTNKDKPIITKTATDRLKKLRDIFYSEDPVKRSWAKEVYRTVTYQDGHVQYYYRLSGYAFRKLHVTEYFNKMDDKGVNALIETAKHMGHSDIKTTYKYIISSVNDRDVINKQGFFNHCKFFSHRLNKEQPKSQTRLNEFC